MRAGYPQALVVRGDDAKALRLPGDQIRLVTQRTRSPRRPVPDRPPARAPPRPSPGRCPPARRAARPGRRGDVSPRDAYRQGADAVDEVGVDPLRLADDLDLREARQDFLPQDLQLQLRQPIADAAMDAEAKRQVLARPSAIDDEGVGV